MLYGSDVSIGTFIFNNLIPATLGNIVGGSILTALIYTKVYGRRIDLLNQRILIVCPLPVYFVKMTLAETA